MSDAVIALARNADVLVHEALYPEAADRLAARVPSAARLKEHLLASHTTAEECGKVAAAAGVKLLVMSHFVPPDDPLVTARAKRFAGRVVSFGVDRPADVRAEELVGQEQHLLLRRDRGHHLHGVAGRAADVGLGLHRCSRVDVADDDGSRGLGLPCAQLVRSAEAIGVYPGASALAEARQTLRATY